jgi:hypothetical protein
MKFPSLLAIVLAFLVESGNAQERKPEFRDAATHEKLVEKHRQTLANKTLGTPVSRDRPDPTKENQPRDLIASSDVISFNGLTTLVPKRAILRLPPQFRDRIDNHQPTNGIVNWLEFYRHNRGWITTVEVTRAQAEGREPFAEALIEQLEKNPNMIVATYSTGPISVLPLKETGQHPITNSEAPIEP